MLLGYDAVDLLLALGAGFACGFLNTAASSGSVVTLPIMIFLGLDAATANATNRLPVLVGALSGALDFARRKAMPWRLAFRIAVPTTLGSLIGAGLAEIVPRRDMGMVVTAAVLFAALLLFKNIKKAVEQAQLKEVQLGPRELLLFFAAGIWLGFIVLGGATCMLLILTLMAGFDLPRANAVRAAALVPVTLVAMLVFAAHGDINWILGGILSVGSIAGGVMGARLSLSANAKRYVFVLLVLAISAELVQLAWHYVFRAMWLAA
jgi:uncharacterized membrane protein YfcA